jgi:hypothetical protein
LEDIHSTLATDDIAITGSDINANKSINLTAGIDITIAAD